MGRIKGAGFVYLKPGTTAWYWRVQVGGKRIARKLNAKNKDEAEKEAQKLAHIASVKSEEEVAVFAARSRKVIKDAEPGIELDKALKLFEKSPKRREAGKQRKAQYQSIYTYLTAFLAVSCPAISTLNEVTQGIVEEFAVKLKKEKGARSYNVYIGSLKTIFTTLLPDDKNPFDNIKKQAENPISSNDMTTEQINAVFAAADGEMALSLMHRPEMAVLFRLGAYTGLRLEDCCILKWTAVNLSQKIITWVPSKTKNSSGKPVHIPIHPALEKQLKTATAWKDESGYILPGVAERYSRNPSGIRQDAQKVIHWSLWKDKKEGIYPPKPDGKYGFHSFRHSFVSRCANAGVPMPVVQAIVGHSSSLVTRIYTHLADSTVRQIINALS
ncbi:MAG: hypothetical protein A2020_07980 [Lentisphaerae bacterium GWF2_45_14]|nr:MAG: hypothetical protein A2020_07980 [Lentisphaerae bacterium GWF2_45_14]